MQDGWFSQSSGWRFPRRGCWALAAAMAEPEPSVAATDRVQGLIERLGDGDFHVRQRAQEELSRMGFAAFDALSVASESDDLEIAAGEVPAASDSRRMGGRRRSRRRQADSAGLRRPVGPGPPRPHAPPGRSAGWNRCAGTCRLCATNSRKCSSPRRWRCCATSPTTRPDVGGWPNSSREQLRPSLRQAARWLLAYQVLRDDPEQGFASVGATG